MYNKAYLDEIKKYNEICDFTFLENKTICLSGATGLIGSFLIDSILINEKLSCHIIALVRNIENAKKRFSKFENDTRLELVCFDLLKEIKIEHKIDYVLHLASLTDPYSYAHFPIEVMNTNYIGTYHLLNLAKEKNAKFLLSSTCEVYGKNEKEMILENDYGYIDILDPRACYNESKKASETLCSCYKKVNQDMKIVIARLSRVYGPTMKMSDTKALSQFIIKTLNNEDIILKSKGEQKFNYTYVGDCVKAITVLLKKNNLHLAYNITNKELMSLKDIALFLAQSINKKVIFDIPSLEEQSGYSKSIISSLNPSLFEDEYKTLLDVNLKDGLISTLKILKENYGK